jgi:muconolactone delta-isomerase
MQKYHVTIQFEMSDELMELVPAHRTYINYLINKGTIDHYAVSMETQRSWVTLNAANKKEVEKLLKKSPLFKFWTFEIDELFVLDGQHYRLPEVNPN